MRVLDLFCCAGGAGMGYHRAGFDVLGIDIEPQVHYPFSFAQADAVSWMGTFSRAVGDFSLIHASPPCQLFTAYRRKGHGVGDGYLNLIPKTRELLQQSGLPYIIENVEGARSELRNPIMLCGSMFGLDVRRHRLFECSFPVAQPKCNHGIWTPRFPAATNRTNLRKTVEVGVWRIPLEVQQSAMGIDWMPVKKLSQAIPPAYTQFLGEEFLLQQRAAA